MKITWLKCILILLTLNSCKRSENFGLTNTTDCLLMEQIVLSSIVYNSLYSISDTIKTPMLIYRYSDSMCKGCVFEDLEKWLLIPNICLF